MSIGGIGTSNYQAWSKQEVSQRNSAFTVTGSANRMASLANTYISERNAKANAVTGRDSYVGTNRTEPYDTGIYSKKDISVLQEEDERSISQAQEQPENLPEEELIDPESLPEDFLELLRSNGLFNSDTKLYKIPVINYIISAPRNPDTGYLYSGISFTNNKITCYDENNKTAWEIDLVNEDQRQKVKDFFDHYTPYPWASEIYSGIDLDLGMTTLKSFWLNLFEKK